MSAPAELAAGLHHWTLRHPEWHPGEFGAEVGSYALEVEDGLVLIDPLLPDGDADPEIEELIARKKGDRIDVIITIPYHARSSERIWRHYGFGAEVMVWGERRVRSRLADDIPFTELTPESELPAGARAFNIGKPRRAELPVHLPSHDALAFGDALVTTPDGELRLWTAKRLDDRKRRWYRDVFVPTLEPLLETTPGRILVTHGEPILSDATNALRAALDAGPWYHPG